MPQRKNIIQYKMKNNQYIRSDSIPGVLMALPFSFSLAGGKRGSDRIEVGFTTTYPINTYHH
jgi:hypothetical protein